MSATDEDKLLSSLLWSDTTFSLSQFVDSYQLPQVISVEEGFYGEDETTSLASGQVLLLHYQQTKYKLVSEDSAGNPIAIPLDCPVKVQVYPLPMQCSYEKILTDQLSFVFPNIRFFRILEDHSKQREKLLQLGNVLEIQQINSKMRSVKFKLLKTNREVSLPFGCRLIFEPLLDGEEYTLEEVKRKFGFPAKVRFLENTSAERKNQERKSMARSVSSLGKVTILHEVLADTQVVATTVGGHLDQKSSLQLPKDLSLEVCVAVGLLSDDDYYSYVVKTLDRGFNAAMLKDFENLDVYEHMDAIKTVNTIQEQLLFERLKSFDELSTKGPELPARNAHNNLTPPALPPKPSNSGSNKLKSLFSRVPPIPKALRKKDPQCSGQTDASLRSNKESEATQKHDSSTLSANQGNLITGFKTEPTSSTDDDQDYEDLREKERSTHKYIYVDLKDDDQTDGDYEDIDELLFTGTTKAQDDPYCKMVNMETKHDITASKSLGFGSQDSLTSNTSELSKTIAHIPKDLSELSVDGVGELLQGLRMECYVTKFREEFVDGEMLMSLDLESLKALDVNPFHVKKLIKIIEGWRPNINSP